MTDDQRNLSALPLVTPEQRHAAAVEGHPSVKNSLMVTSASWLCPICNRPGDRHLVVGGCFVGNVAREALALRQEAKEAYRRPSVQPEKRDVTAQLLRSDVEEWRRIAWDHRDETDSARIVALADALLAIYENCEI